MSLKGNQEFLVVCYFVSLISLLFIGDGRNAVAGGAPSTEVRCLPYQQHTTFAADGSQSCGLPGFYSNTRQSAPFCSPDKIMTFRPGLDKTPPPLVPVEIRDVGPIKPIIVHTVGLAGAIIAAPFRLLEAVAPTARRGDPPSASAVCQYPSNACITGIPPSPPIRIPGYFSGPVPNGYGLGIGQRIPAWGGASQSQSYAREQYPPSTLENRFPQLEPQTLLGGIVKFPSTMVTQGRILGDLGSQQPPPH